MYSWERERKTKEQIEKKFRELGFSSYRIVDELARLLCSNEAEETVERIARKHRGRSWGDDRLLVATTARLIVLKDSYSCQIEKDMSYSEMHSIAYDDKFLSGKSGKLTLFTTDNKTEIFEHLDKKQGQDLAEFIRRCIENTRTNEDTISLLERLSQLKRQGLITEEEFNKQKSKLLKS